MTAATLDGTSLKTRLLEIIDATLDGFGDEDGCDGNCGDHECERKARAREVLDAAFWLISRTYDENAILAAHLGCFAALTGIPEAQRSVQIIAIDGGTER